MTNSINAISSAIIGANAASAPLTAATKGKLIALGVDISAITTESQGKAALVKAQTVKKTPEKPAENTVTVSPEKSLQDEVKSLAVKAGIFVEQDAKTSDMLIKISEKLAALKKAAGTDTAKAKAVEEYSNQYSLLSEKYAQMELSKVRVNTGLDGMANYNKAMLGLK